MMKQLVIAALAIGATATPAFAQEDSTFEGPWVGATAGYDSIGADDSTDSGSEDGVAYGFAAGYDMKLAGMIVGIEAELGESSVSARGADILEAGDELRLSAGRDIYAGVRVGLPISNRMMAYAKGGYTDLRYEAAYTLDDEVTESSATSGGYRLGAGMEFKLGKPFARIEYRYSDYGSFSDSDLETDRHQVMVTAGLRF